MNRNTEYEKKISEYGWDALLSLWKQIEDRKSDSEWGAGRAYEYLILRAFQLDGLKVRWPYNVGGLEQIDGVVYSDGIAFLIECKDHVEPVNIEPIAKLNHQLSRRPPNAMGIVFSYSGFTDSAVRLTPPRILLWQGDEVSYAIRKRYMRGGLMEKYCHCIENGLPEYHIQTEAL
jgi:hypothetical protein